MPQRIAPVLLALSLLAAPAAAQLQAEVYVSGLVNPVAFVQDPANAAVHLVVQQGGRIRVVVNGVLEAADFLDLSSAVSTGGERGLLGMALAPDYATSGRLYVNFTNTDGHTVVARFRRSLSNPLMADPASRFDLLWPGGQRFILQPYANHNGGHLAFGPDGYLYIGLGDGGSSNDPQNRAQTPGTLLGKMLRIDVAVAESDGAGYTVPAGNPFTGRPGVLPEIWAFGLRNPWRYSFDEPRLGGTGALIIGDVGQGAVEEIDYEPAGRGGRNYGWRNREGTRENNNLGPPASLPLTNPIYEYGRASGQSVTGGYVYRGTIATLRGRYFFADFVTSRVWSVGLGIDPVSGEATAGDLREHTADLGGATLLGGISAFGVDASGELYIVSWGGGRVFRIVARDSLPLMNIDTPGPGAVVQQPFVLAGWAVDARATSGTGIDTLHVWAFREPGSNSPPVFLGVASQGGARPDVAAAGFGAAAALSGFGINVSGLAPGAYRLMIFGWVTASGGFDVVRSVDVTIAASTRMWIDTPGHLASVTKPFFVAGWAFDPSAPSGTGVDTVHVWAYPAGGGAPVFLGAAGVGGARPDVGTAFGARFTLSAFSLFVTSIPTGTWDIVAFAHSVVTASFDAARVVRVTVR